MLKILGFDLETSLGNKKLFGPDSKDTNNDFYTIIYGNNPNEKINVLHKTEGWNRTLPVDIFDGVDIVVGHNLGFDLGYVWETPEFKRFKKSGGQIWCTAQAQYLLSGKRHKFPSLAELQYIYCGEKTKESRISWCFNNGISAEKIIKAQDRCPRLWKLYNKYCADDVSTALKIFGLQYKRASDLGVLTNIKMHMQGLLGILSISKTGMNVDVVRCEETLKELKLKSMEFLEEAEKIVAPMWDERLPAFNINSPQHKSAILFGGEFKTKEKRRVGTFQNGNPRLKNEEVLVYIEGFSLTKSLTMESKINGRYATDAKVVNKICTTSSNSQAVEYCKLQKKAMNYGKMASTYLEPFLNYSIDGVLYPKYNTTLTVTGRLSSSTPNMQNIPASGDMFETIQGNLIAPEGWTAVSIDYNQLEPFTTALLTEDYMLAQDLLNGVCLHCRAVSWIPRMAEGKSYEEIYQLAVVEKHPDWVLKRKKAKAINFKRAYGGGAKGLAEAESLDVEDVRAVFDGQDEAYPQVKEFNTQLFESLVKNQQISRVTDYSKKSKAGRMFEFGLELLPIFSREEGDKPIFRTGEYRHHSVFRSKFGDMWAFEEVGQLDRYGKLRRAYSTTQTKNYHIQGTAGTIVEMAIAECMEYVNKHSTEVKMVRQIHDELGFYVKKGGENKHIPAICAIMADIQLLFKKYLQQEVGFNFKVEAKVGSNFAEMEIYNERGE